MFADDYLLVARATIKDATCLRLILDAYHYYFGQAVNVTRSHLAFSPSVPVTIKNQIRRIYSMPVKQGVWSYLGVPLTGNKLVPADFNYLIDRILKKVDAWK